MAAPNYTADDFKAALQNLLPRGRAWPRDPEATQSRVAAALAKTFERSSARASGLIADAFPLATFELLPEWEVTLGLPDPCAGDSPTLQARRAQVVARFTSNGGQSVPYLVRYAAALGFAVSVREFSPFRVGASRVGGPLCGEDWAYAWAVRLPLNTVTYFRIGQSGVGEPLATWGNAALECELQKLKPAHTVLHFEYT